MLSFSKRDSFFPSLAIQIFTFSFLFYWHLAHLVHWNLYCFTTFLLQPLLFLYWFIQISTFSFLEGRKGSSWGGEHIYIYLCVCLCVQCVYVCIQDVYKKRSRKVFSEGFSETSLFCMYNLKRSCAPLNKVPSNFVRWGGSSERWSGLANLMLNNVVPLQQNLSSGCLTMPKQNSSYDSECAVTYNACFLQRFGCASSLLDVEMCDCRTHVLQTPTVYPHLLYLGRANESHSTI